jgi:hypothetical protein
MATTARARVQLIEAIWAQDYERAQKIQVLLLQHNERIAPIREGLQNALRVLSRINPICGTESRGSGG